MPDLSLAGALIMPFIMVLQTIRMTEMIDDANLMMEAMLAEIRRRTA